MYLSRLSDELRIVLMNGVAIIVLGFVAFGVLHTTNENFQPWQWYVRLIFFVALSPLVLMYVLGMRFSQAHGHHRIDHADYFRHLLVLLPGLTYDCTLLERGRTPPCGGTYQSESSWS